MKPYLADIDEAAAVIRRRWHCRPKIGIVLGTGLGCFASQIDVEHSVPYEDVPHFPQCTAEGHRGKLLCGWLAGAPVLVMDGRWHVYEGHGLDAITMPVRLMRSLGVEMLILSNAAGGMNPSYRCGDIMVVDDHINLMRRQSANNPITESRTAGRASSATRLRSPPPDGDPGRFYCPRLIKRALEGARRAGFAAHRGVYVAMTGPNYETRAEYRFLREIGGDAVGMSTVPEAVAAAECGMRVLALSTITNICRPDRLVAARHDDVIKAATAAESKVRAIILHMIAAEVQPAEVQTDAVQRVTAHPV